MEVYKDLVKQGSVNEDVRQIELLKVLTNLYEKLKNYNINDARAVIKNHLGTTSATGTAKTGSFDPKAISRQIKPHPTGLPKSLYIYGDVGCGKTFLMVCFRNIQLGF